MQAESFKNILRRAAIAGNVLFVLWILYNGMNENWKAKPVQLVVYITMISLLLVNSYLIFKKNK